MNSSNTKSTSTSNSNALSRRRAGLVAAHEARGSSRRSTASAPAIRPTVSQELSMRALNLLDRYNKGGQHQPTRSESCSDLCYSRTTPVLKKKKKKDRANIPSLDQKIQTLMNLEGHEALHSSLISSPIPPQRELSNPNLCPSGHSRATVLLEDQVHPTTIPDQDQKEQTFRNRQGQEFLHSSMTSPLQPFREPSNPNLCPSGHSRASSTVDHPTTIIPDIDQKALTLRQNQSMHSSSPLIKPTREPSNRSILLGTSSSHHNSVATPSAHPSLPSLMSLPTTPNTVTSTTIASYVFDEACSEEDDDILSEEETETTYHHHDITLKYPLLGPTTTTATNTVALASVGENVERVDDDVSQLKRYWANLGERIHAMEEESAEKSTANWDIEGSLAELLKRIEAIESQQAKREQKELKMVGGRVAEKKPSLGPSPMEKSKSKSRSASSAKTASSSRTKKSSRSSHTTTGTTTTKSRRSKSADAGPRKSSRSKKRSESVSRPTSKSSSTSQKPSRKNRSSHKDPATMQDGSASSSRMVDESGGSQKPTTTSRKTRSSHKDPATMQDGSASSSRMVDESGGSQKPTSSRKTRSSHKDPTTMQDGSASSSRMVDESGGSQKPTSSRKTRSSHKDPAMTMQDGSASSSRMVDESGGSHSSRRSNGLLQDGSGRRRVKRRDSLERHIIMSIPGKRLSSRRLKAARSKLVHVDGTKSENDAAASRGGKQVKGRSPRGDDALLKAASSPGSTSFASPSSKPSPSSSRASSSVSSKSRRPMSSSSSRQRRISRYSNRSLSRLDARPAPVLGDLDTMDVSWWRYHHEQQSVASSSAGSMPVMNKLRSRAGNKLEF